MPREEFFAWQRELASIYRVNPFREADYDKQKRRFHRKLRRTGTSLSPEHLLAQHGPVGQRLALMEHWLSHYSGIGAQYPPLWQSAFLCLTRFALEPSLGEPIISESRLPHVWSRIAQLGQAYQVQEVQELLSIAERVRRASLHLQQVKGISQSLRELKQQIWYACFGEDLLRLLVYGQVLQELNVLILGPTGSGKELVAQVLIASSEGTWQSGSQGDLQWQPYATEALNLAEFPSDLMSAQIVGYRKGAFTGAGKDFRGVLSRCDQGCVLLDEIGELPPSGQVILLRALETRQVRPLGAEDPEAASCRVVTATHRPLDQPEQVPHFRRDLFYRLAGAIIQVPSLSQRREDLLPIALGFLDSWGIRGQASLHLEDPRHRITEWLQRPEMDDYSWPGNVRELKRMLARLLLGLENTSQERRPSSLPASHAEIATPVTPLAYSSYDMQGVPPPALQPQVPWELTEGRWSLQQMKQWYIEHVLDLTNHQQKEAAKRLGVHRTTLYHAKREKKKGQNP